MMQLNNLVARSRSNDAVHRLQLQNERRQPKDEAAALKALVKTPNSSNHCAATVGCDGKEGFHWQEAAGLLSGLGCHVRAAPATNTSAW